MRLLVIADRPLEQPVALRKAARIAKAIGAEVTVAGFAFEAEINAPKSSDSCQKKCEIIAENKRRLETLSKDIFPSTVSFTIDSIWTDDIGEWVAEKTQNQDFDLIVKASHRSGTFFHTPLDWQLIRQINVPLLFVTPSEWHARPKVLATVDIETDDAVQTEVNRNVLKQAFYLAQAMEGEMLVASCISTSKVLSDLDLVNLDKKKAHETAAVSTKIDDLLSELDIRQGGCHIRAGNVVKIIHEVADKTKADIVVMGSVGRKKLKGLILGSTAENLLQNIKRDVLVMRPSQA